MSCPVLLPKLELNRQTMTAVILLKIFTKTFFLLKFVIEIYYKVKVTFLINLS